MRWAIAWMLSWRNQDGLCAYSDALQRSIVLMFMQLVIPIL